MLTAPEALALADRRQRRAVSDAAAFAAALGEPVRFVHRLLPAGGMVFEAVALDSARTCAVVDEHGALRLVADERSPEPWERPATLAPRVPGATRRAAEAALRTAARPPR